jgi:hypothetical protein
VDATPPRLLSLELFPPDLVTADEKMRLEAGKVVVYQANHTGEVWVIENNISF